MLRLAPNGKAWLERSDRDRPDNSWRDLGPMTP